MVEGNALADYLRQLKDEELRKYIIKDKLATSMYERKIVTEVDEAGNESIREISVPEPVPELLVEDWATTNFSMKDSRVKMACFKLGLAFSSVQLFTKQSGKTKGGQFNIDMNPSLLRFQNLLGMLLLSGKATDGEFTKMLLRQHIRQEEFIEQRQPQGGFLAPKQNV